MNDFFLGAIYPPPPKKKKNLLKTFKPYRFRCDDVLRFTQTYRSSGTFKIIIVITGEGSYGVVTKCKHKETGQVSGLIKLFVEYFTPIFTNDISLLSDSLTLLSPKAILYY